MNYSQDDVSRFLVLLFLILSLAGIGEACAQVRGTFKRVLTDGVAYVRIERDMLTTVKRVEDGSGDQVCVGYPSPIEWDGMTLRFPEGTEWKFRVGAPGKIHITFPDGVELAYTRTTENPIGQCSNKKKRKGKEMGV